MERCRDWYGRIRALKWLSPGSFVLCAATFAATFLVLHLAGWREKTNMFCGTLASGRSAQTAQSFQAVCYTLFYLSMVIVSPILVLGAGVFQGLIVWDRRRSAGRAGRDKNALGTARVSCRTDEP